MSSNLVEIFKHNLWANLRVLDACSRLTYEQLNTTAPGTYGNIRSTLLHILGAEERYVARFTGQPRPPSRESADFTDFDDLRAAATKSGQALIEIAEQDAPMQVLTGIGGDGKTFAIDSTVLMIQAINHATEHRAHINTIFTHLGIEPCDIDGWAYGDAHGQVKTG